jgi:hypothetical protein
VIRRLWAWAARTVIPEDSLEFEAPKDTLATPEPTSWKRQRR